MAPKVFEIDSQDEGVELKGTFIGNGKYKSNLGAGGMGCEDGLSRGMASFYAPLVGSVVGLKVPQGSIGTFVGEEGEYMTA
jgi:hypothetical protein